MVNKHGKDMVIKLDILVRMVNKHGKDMVIKLDMVIKARHSSALSRGW